MALVGFLPGFLSLLPLPVWRQLGTSKCPPVRERLHAVGVP